MLHNARASQANVVITITDDLSILWGFSKIGYVQQESPTARDFTISVYNGDREDVCGTAKYYNNPTAAGQDGFWAHSADGAYLGGNFVSLAEAVVAVLMSRLTAAPAPV